MRSCVRSVFAAAACLALCVLASGCNSASKLKGKLTNGGKAVTVTKDGLIQMSFIDASDASKHFGVNTKGDGSFETVDPIPPGKYKITVRAFEAVNGAAGPDQFDEKFSDPAKTPIVRDVSGGSMDIDLAKPTG